MRAGELAVWEGLVPASLPGPAADLDALNGVKRKSRAPVSSAAPGGLADGASVLDGAVVGGSEGGAAVTEDDYDRDDSFLADSGGWVGGWVGVRQCVTLGELLAMPRAGRQALARAPRIYP